MPIKLAVFIATSLDGYIARANGDIDWLPQGDSTQDSGYQTFSDSIDTIIMGRVTYETCLTFGAWPYVGKRTVVWSRGAPKISNQLRSQVEVSGLPPRQLVEQLAASGARSIYVDGGQTIQAFLAAGLIDEMTITVIPVLIGGGLPLFGALPNDIHCELVAVRSFANGLVQSKYHVKKNYAFT
jgi:dihydrofolate reductase